MSRLIVAALAALAALGIPGGLLVLGEISPSQALDILEFSGVIVIGGLALLPISIPAIVMIAILLRVTRWRTRRGQ